ncbi:MAG: cysteine synthase A [Oscillospiraceae bacterium]|nr:cysteine synthase A [Oscillospiraceae bacterium]
MRIYTSITELIGKTPLLELRGFARERGIASRILGKLEYFNPAGSVKDRVALAMLEAANLPAEVAAGASRRTTEVVVVEATSGNTGIGLAAIAAAKGYRLILTMPESMSVERRTLLKAYGAELVLTPKAAGMQGAIDKARELADEISGAFMPSQFTNPANPAAHRETTGVELWEDSGGKIDVLVAGVGTGGTISGVGGFLKSKNPAIKIIAVEPDSSAVLGGGTHSPHKIQGIGAGFVPATLDTSVYDEVIAVSEENAFECAKLVATTDGILVGISSGAALVAAAEVALRSEYADKTIAVILPDTGERYLSMF